MRYFRLSEKTRVYPGIVKPTRKGVYERKMPGGLWVYALWDGKRWHAGSDSPATAARQVFISAWQELPWRGLKEQSC